MSDQRYYAAERGRVLELLDVTVREANNPFSGHTRVLIEPCPDEQPNVADDVEKIPCWPDEGQPASQELLETMESGFPGYRYSDAVLRAAQYLNRDIGAFRRSWIIGTDPLAVAFLKDGPQEIPPRIQRRIQKLDARVENQTALATTGPTADTKVWRKIAFAIYELQKGSEILSMDLRERDPRFVEEVNRDTQADVILLFPRDIHIAANGHPALLNSYPDMQAKILQLAKPQPLWTLMEALTDPEKLEREADKVEEIPVSRFPPGIEQDSE